MSEPLNPAQLSSLSEYANDLRGMEKREIEEEIQRSSDLIAEEESWLEALIARQSQMKLAGEW